MAIAQYKVVKEYDDKKIGYVLISDPADIQEDVERGRVALQKYLDPEDPKDAAVIEHFKDNPTGEKKPRVKAPKQENTNETAPARVSRKAAPRKSVAKAPAKAAAKKSTKKA